MGIIDYTSFFTYTHYYLKKRYCTNQNLPFTDQLVWLNLLQSKSKLYVPVPIKYFSFDVFLKDNNEKPEINFVIRYKEPPSDDYNRYDFTEDVCTIQCLNNELNYTFLSSFVYDYNGSTYETNASLHRGLNPLNVGGLVHLKNYDHKVHIRASDIRKINIFHMEKLRASVGIKSSGDWLYINVISGIDYIDSFMFNMYF
ncbi:MAG: hypothetical protein ACOCQD_03075 [archaeon]